MGKGEDPSFQRGCLISVLPGPQGHSHTWTHAYPHTCLHAYVHVYRHACRRYFRYIQGSIVHRCIRGRLSLSLSPSLSLPLILTLSLPLILICMQFMHACVVLRPFSRGSMMYAVAQQLQDASLRIVSSDDPFAPRGQVVVQVKDSSASPRRRACSQPGAPPRSRV